MSVSTAQTPSFLDQIIEHCQNAKFTGLLRMRTQQGEGELWFLSGVRDDARFGVSHGDEALARMERATNPTFELVARLPPPSGVKKSYPLDGALGELRPVDLFRFCESNALTCTLVLERGPTKVHAKYQLGELLGVESDSADAAAVADMLQWNEGSYQFELPPLELPDGIPMHATPGPPATAGGLADFLGVPALAESKRPAAVEEIARKADDAKRKASEEAAKRKASEEAAKRKADDEAAKRKADDEAAKRKADDEAAKRKADDEVARRRAEELAARVRAEEEAAKRAADEARLKAEHDAEARRKADEESAKRKVVAVHRQIAIEPPPETAEQAAERRAAKEAAEREAEEARARRRADSAPELEAREVDAEEPAAEPEPAAEAKVAAEAPTEAPAEAEAPEAPPPSEPAPKSKAKKRKRAEPKEERESEAPAEVAETPRRAGAFWTALLLVLAILAAFAYWYFRMR